MRDEFANKSLLTNGKLKLFIFNVSSELKSLIVNILDPRRVPAEMLLNP
jgi:hypothetical protein